MPDPARINHISFSGEKHPVVDSRISDANITTWNSYSSSISDVPVERGIGTNSVQQKGNDLTVYGNYSFAEGTSSTDAKERGLDGDSTNAEIIVEWESSSPETDKFTFVKGEAAHAEGNNGLALGNHSHVEGNGCIAADNSAHAEGTGTQALGKYSHAEGLETVASAQYSHTEGKATYAQEDAAHSEGNSTKARARGSHAEGYLSEASKTGYSSNTLTPKAQPSSSGSGWYNGASHAEGNATIAQGLGAHAEGEKTFANERATHAEGKGTIVKSEYSHAEGNSTIAGAGHDDGTAAHAEGESTKATAWASHAEGYQSEANAWTSHAEGANTVAGTANSQPSAYNNDTEGRFSHAEGNGTWAKGSASHAEGRHTQALKKYDHAEGWGTTANGIASHAEGEDTQANAECSHAEGWQTRTSNDCEHAEGQYNASHTGSTSDEKTIHSVGIGTSSQRKNAFEIMQSGDTYMVGVGGYDGTNPSGSESVSVAMIQGEIVQEISPAEQYVSQELMNLLAIAPTMKVRWNRTGTTYNKKIFIYHPLMNYEDAEIVLLSYARKNGARSKRPNEYNKGYSVATPWKDPSDYFTFSAENNMEDLSTFMSSFRGWNDNEGDWVMPVRRRHFGIALRIPNPAYNGPETPNKNNTYHGVPESIWSAVLRVGIHYDNYHDIWGIGIK